MPPKSKSPAPRAKSASSVAKKSVSPPPAAKKAAAVEASSSPKASPKASPKRAASAKKSTPVPKKAASASPKPSAKKSAAKNKKKEESESEESDIDDDVSEQLSFDDDNNEDELPQTQNDMKKEQQPAAVAKNASPSPIRLNKDAAAPVVAAAATTTTTTTGSVKNTQVRSSVIHNNPQVEVQTGEATKRMSQTLTQATHALYNYLKTKSAEIEKKNAEAASKNNTTAQQQQNSVNDVLALFGPSNSNNNNSQNKQNNSKSSASGAVLPVIPISVEVNFLRAPEPSRIPWSVVLPNAVHDIEKSICLITPAPQEKYREQIEDENAEIQPPANIQKIMDVQKLEGRFQDPVALRALAKSYSAFWVHNEVENFPRVLTGEFMSYHFPVWVNGKKSLHINERLQRTLGCVMIPRQGKDNLTVVVGHTKQTEQQFAENVLSFCGNVVTLLAGGWKDVLSIRLSFKDLGSDRRITMPVYAHDFRESHGLGTDAVRAPKPAQLPTNLRNAIKQQNKQKSLGDSLSAIAKNVSAVAGVVRGRDEEEEKKEEQTVKPENSANNNNSKAPSAKKSVQKKDDVVVVAQNDDDEDDDDIPQIDAAPAATNKPAAKKPAPKGKKVGGKK